MLLRGRVSVGNRCPVVLAAAIVAAGLMPLTSSNALANDAKTATGTDLSQPGSYTPAGLPTETDDLLLGGNGTTYDLPGTAAITVGSLNTSTADAVTLTNTGVGYATITLGGPGSTGNLTPGASPTDLIYAGGNLAIGPTTKQYYGTGFVDLSLGRDGSMGAALGKTLTLTSAIRNNGHTLTIGGSGAVQIVTPGGSSAATFQAPYDYGLADAGGLSGSGGLTVATNGTNGYVQLFGRNSYTGVTTINSGAQLAVMGSIDNSSAIVNNGSLGFGRRTFYSVAQVIAGTGEVNIGGTDAGRVTLNGANSYTGRTYIDWGTLNATTLANGGQASSIGASSSDAANLRIGRGGWTIPGSSTLRYAGGAVNTDRLFTSEMPTIAPFGSGDISSLIESSGSGPLAFTNTGAIAYDTPNVARMVTLGGTNASTGNTFAPAIANNGTGVVTFAKNGTGTWKLTGTNTYTGKTSIYNGLLIAGSTASMGTGTIEVGDAGAVGTDFPLTQSFLNRITGTGAVVLSNDSSTNLNFTVWPSLLLGAAPGKTVTYSGTANFGSNTRLGGGGGTLIYTKPITGGSVQIGNVPASISYPGSLPSSTTVLTAANTYSGGTTINRGILRLDNGDALGTGSVTIKSKAALVPFADVDQALINRMGTTAEGSIALRGDSSVNLNFSNSFRLMLGAYTSATYTGTIVPYSNTYRLGGGGGTLNFNSDLVGGRSLYVGGNGLWGKVVLNGNNTYTLGTIVVDGQLTIGDSSGLPANSQLSLNGKTEVDFGGRSQTLSSIYFGDIYASNALDATLRNGSITVAGTTASTLRPSNYAYAGNFDVSGLTRFTYASPAAPATSLAIGFDSLPSANASTEGPATVKLAKQTELNAQTLILGGLRSTDFDLGSDTTLNSNTITLGKNGSSSTAYTMTNTQFRFAPGSVNPTFKIRNAAGTGAATTVTLANSGQATTTLDLSNGTSDVLAGQFNVSSSTGTRADSVASVRVGGAGSVWNLGTLAVGTNSGSASSLGVGIQTFTQNAGLVLADKVRLNHFIGGTPGAYETLLSTYELGTPDSAATLSINSIAIGSTEVTTKSRSTLKFNNGRIEAFDPTRTGGRTATGAEPAATALIAGGISVFDAQDDRRILHIELADTGTHTLAAGAGRTLEVSPTAAISGPGGVTIEGPGTVYYNTANTYAGITTVNSGTLELARTARDVIRYNGGLDVRGGSVVFDYLNDSPHTWVRAGLVQSYASGFTAGRFRSSTADADHGLGYVDDGTSLVLRYTLYGDADLDGVVDFNDFLALQNGFGSNTGWQGGDFNYDNVSNFNDFLILQNHFGQSMNGMPVAITAQQVAAMTAFARSVPEPAVTAMLLAALPLMRRRRVA